jgi:uncharacterized protein YijF (DUF1287 family)
MRLPVVIAVLSLAACAPPATPDTASPPPPSAPDTAPPAPPSPPLATTEPSSPEAPLDFGSRLALAAEKQTETEVTYDPSYVRLAYPGGDVAPDKGVCADVVIRAYRVFGADLQVLVHRDMVRAFALYPQRWGLSRPDTNIDHRRVPNLETFFRRHGVSLAVTMRAADYKPGDLVSWIVAGSLPHIGIVSAKRTPDGARPLMVHNIGAGPKLEDVLFEFPIVGHFRYRPQPAH